MSGPKIIGYAPVSYNGAGHDYVVPPHPATACPICPDVQARAYKSILTVMFDDSAYNKGATRPIISDVVDFINYWAPLVVVLFCIVVLGLYCCYVIDVYVRRCVKRKPRKKTE